MVLVRTHREPRHLFLRECSLFYHFTDLLEIGPDEVVLEIVVYTFNLVFGSCVVELQEFFSFEGLSFGILLGVCLEKANDSGVISLTDLMSSPEDKLGGTFMRHFTDFGVAVLVEPFAEDLGGFWSKTLVYGIDNGYNWDVFLDGNLSHSHNVSILEAKLLQDHSMLFVRDFFAIW